MAKIDLTIFPDRLKNTIKRARERNIIIPTFAQMKNPALAPEKIKAGFKIHRFMGSQSPQLIPHHLEK